MAIRHRQARSALRAVIESAITALSFPVEFKWRDGRLIDPEDIDETGVRAAVSQVDAPVPAGEMLMGEPPSWDVTARFTVGIEAIGGDNDQHRFEIVEAIQDAVSAAIGEDYTLGGVVLHAEIVDFEPEDLKQDGMPADTLAGLSVEVLFVGGSPTGI